MATMNVVMLMGNLTRDPEIRSLPSGTAVADLRLAISEEYKDRDGVEQKKVCYVDVTAWDKQAEFCRQFLHKGDPILVEGKLDYHEWQTDQGEKRNKLRVRAARVSGLAKPVGNGETPVGSGQAAVGRGQEAVGSQPTAGSSAGVRRGGKVEPVEDLPSEEVMPF
jgi:single-strand DNA-binding protein